MKEAKDKVIIKKLEKSPVRRVVISAPGVSRAPSNKGLRNLTQRFEKKIGANKKQILAKQRKGQSTATLEAQVFALAFARNIISQIQIRLKK